VAPWTPLPEHEIDRRRETLDRLRSVALVILGLAPIGALTNLALFPMHALDSVLAPLANAIACLLTLVLVRMPWALRHAIGLALGFNVVVCGSLLLMLAISREAMHALGGVVLVAMIGSALLYPWGVAAQAVLSLFLAGGYLILLPWSTLPEVTILNVSLAVSLATAISIAGARILENQRREKWRLIEELADASRRSQSEADISSALARAGEELIGSLSLPVTLETICRLTTELMDCDSSHTLLRRPEDGTYAIIAMHGEADEHAEAMRVTRLPRSALAPMLKVFERKDIFQVVIPELDRPAEALGHHMGYTVILHIALRRGRELIGIQSACRRGRVERFAPEQQRVASGIGHLASIALENARLTSELEEASRLKSDFVSTMSHELRTPLNSILGYGDLLLDGAFGELSHEQGAVLRRVAQSTRQLHELVATTLDLSRLQSDTVPLRLERVSLPELLLSVIGEARELEEKPGVALLWDVARDLPPIETDPMKLKVVLKNLISNAIKFTDAGSVAVSTTTIRNEIEVAIRDTGVGIPRQSLRAICEPFRQAERSLTRRYEGAGLGLYVAQRLLVVLGGSVSVESEVDKGSVFRVRVPLRSQRLGRSSEERTLREPVFEVLS